MKIHTKNTSRFTRKNSDAQNKTAEKSNLMENNDKRLMTFYHQGPFISKNLTQTF